MTGITIIVADAAPARLRTALMLALTVRALDGRARIMLDAAAVALLAGDPDRIEPAPGLPSLAALIDDAAGEGVDLILCQSGLAAHGLSLETLEPPWRAGGMVEVMAGLGDDRLLIA